MDSLPPLHNLRLALQYEPIGAIASNPRDPRRYGGAELRRIATSQRRLGVMPLVVTAERIMLSGNVWLEAAKLAGYTDVPVIVADHLSAAEADAFMLAQVRLVERGEWDERLLGQVLRDLTVQDLDFNVSITGFDAPEIDIRVSELTDGSDGQDDEFGPTPTSPAVTRAGDLWSLGRHRLLCGDARSSEDYVRLLEGEVVDAVFTDPPYNVAIAGNVSSLRQHGEFAMASGEMSPAEFTGFLTEVLTLAAAHSRPGAVHMAAMDWRHMQEMLSAGAAAYERLLNLCVWVKDRSGMGSFYRSRHELFFVFKVKGARHTNNVQLGRFGRDRSNVWQYPAAASFGRGGEEGDLLKAHPTVKPVALIADALKDVTDRKDVVLDPFVGSGSTLVAAEKCGRSARGLEIDPRYIDVAVRRWQRWTGEIATLEEGGESFAAVEARRAAEACDE